MHARASARTFCSPSLSPPPKSAAVRTRLAAGAAPRLPAGRPTRAAPARAAAAGLNRAAAAATIAAAHTHTHTRPRGVAQPRARTHTHTLDPCTQACPRTRAHTGTCTRARARTRPHTRARARARHVPHRIRSVSPKSPTEIKPISCQETAFLEQYSFQLISVKQWSTWPPIFSLRIYARISRDKFLGNDQNQNPAGRPIPPIRRNANLV